MLTSLAQITEIISHREEKKWIFFGRSRDSDMELGYGVWVFGVGLFVLFLISIACSLIEHGRCA
jgi:hypothetical protein